MGNLKYNPLLKLNLQEETSAEEIIGDGYTEKLLMLKPDFTNDIENILTDTGEIRNYITLPGAAGNYNIGKKKYIFFVITIAIRANLLYNKSNLGHGAYDSPVPLT